MTPTEAVDLTSKSLHSNLLKGLLGYLNLIKDLPEEKRNAEIAQQAYLIAKEIYVQAREEKQFEISK